jgi:hypothetical protein
MANRSAPSSEQATLAQEASTMPLTVLNGPFIQKGESLSDALDCTGGVITRITMPGAWTPANLTFQISSDGALFNNLVDRKGEEIQIVVVPGSAVVLSQYGEYLKAVAFLKVRSGTGEHPVVQQDVREFAIAIEPAAGEP